MLMRLKASSSIEGLSRGPGEREDPYPSVLEGFPVLDWQLWKSNVVNFAISVRDNFSFLRAKCL
jgi:hypothetical protein